MAFDPLEILRGGKEESRSRNAPLGGTRDERVQRLQIGLFGLGTMVLLVGLANIVMVSAQNNQASVATEEVTAAPTEDVPPPPPRDPLADAGVVPDLPAEPEPTVAPTQAPALQESGNATPLPID